MQLKSIEITGFKSFAEKTNISFPNGMTGIVGPNGSGKSNIAEAIRWVLGEQSAKNLRGSRMPDVIFSGSADRRSLNMAAVTLLLDNSDHYLDSPYSEIKVSRKLFRNGDSAYFINEKQCRLKDIAGLFMDTGIGQGSLSIISQGNVEEIFNSKPIDRRSIIENAAGVYKYKRQKSTAQTEILQTNDNLDRVNDIIHELKVRLGPLEEQSSQATDYLDQKKRLDELEKRQLIMTTKTQLAQKQTASHEITKVQKIVSRLSDELDQKDLSSRQLKAKLDAGRQQVDQLNSKLMNLATHIESLKSKQRLSSQESDFKNADLDRLSNQLATVNDQLTGLTQKLSHSASVVDQTQVSLANNQTRLRQIKRAASENSVPKIEAKIKELHTQYFDLLQQQSDLKNQISLNKKDRQQFKEQTKAQQVRIEQAADQLKTLERNRQVKQQAVKSLASQFEAAQQQLTGLQKQLKEKSKFVETTQSNWLAALKIAEQAKAKSASLKALHDSYQAFYRGTANLLKHRKKIAGIYGPVADFLQVADKFVKAIETALGAQAQHVIVKDNASASAAIKFMTKNRYGRVTLLPVDTIRGRHLSTGVITEARQTEGFVGIASKLVSAPAKFQEIVDFLLGTTVIADTLDHAIQISKRIHHRTRVVSLDGQIVNAGGSLTGGANRSANQGVLVQKSELAKLEASTREMAVKLTEKQRQLQSAKQALNDSQTAHDRCKQTVFELQQQLTGQRDALATLQKSFEDKKRELATLKLALVNTKNQNQDQTEAELLSDKAQLDQQVTQIAAEIEKRQKQLGNIKKTAENYDKKAQSLHDQIVISKEQLQHYQDDQKRFSSQVDQLKGHQQQLTAKLKSLQTELATQTNPEKIDQAIQQSKNEKIKLTRSLEKQKEIVSQADRQYEQLQSEIRTQQLDLNNVTYELKAKQQAYQELTQKLTASLGQLKSTFGISATDLGQKNWHWDQETLSRQIKMLRTGIDEIGPVNISAIQEFQDVSERYHFLLKQQEDLLAAKNHLTVTMGKMDRTIAQKFGVTFNQIASSFSKVFKEMFGGGEAKLVLTDPDHLLTTGIEIMVKPPGKNYRSLSLLSGGEKALTAITLLFAIIKVSPVPFCILDEAEAALDPYNADRFARYLKKFGDETQFIVITHRKETMIYADTLYGITMQESGVSKVISVNLDNLKTEVS